MLRWESIAFFGQNNNNAWQSEREQEDGDRKFQRTSCTKRRRSAQSSRSASTECCPWDRDSRFTNRYLGCEAGDKYDKYVQLTDDKRQAGRDVGRGGPGKISSHTIQLHVRNGVFHGVACARQERREARRRRIMPATSRA